jgi:phage tail protein X
MATETLTFNGSTPLDLLLWRRFGREVVGLVEQTLAANQGLAHLGVCPPLGTKIVVTIPKAAPPPSARKTVSLYD